MNKARVSVGVALIAISGASHADWTSTCKDVGDVAETVMSARQSGVPMANVMRAVGENQFAQRMVLSAYKTPRMSTKQYQRQVVGDFRDTWYAACVEVLMPT